VHTCDNRCHVAAAGRLTAGGGRRRSAPSPYPQNEIAAGGSKTAGGVRSSIAAAGAAGGVTMPTARTRRPAAASRLTAGGHTGVGHIASLLGDHAVQDSHRLSDGDHVLSGGVLGRVQRHVKTGSKNGIESFDIIPQGFSKSVNTRITLRSLRDPGHPTNKCPIQRSSSQTVSITKERFPWRFWYMPENAFGHLHHSKWLQSRDPMQPGIPLSAFRVRTRCSSSVGARRKFEGPNSSSIKRVNCRTDIAMAEADSRTYLSVMSGAFPHAMTWRAPTTFCKG